ncbi:MAG: aldo/keto reductase [Elusimicrobia bacterium]|nr:aldo/keto reductase [Elusimicrobiota bacterium]
MEKRALGSSGLEIGVLALGTMGWGSDWMGSTPVDEKTARSLLDFALDSGVNLIDTADIYGYGAAETMLGRILGKRRQRVLLATKVRWQMDPDNPASGGLSKRRIRAALDASLKRLKTDYLDIYMPHAPDNRVPLEETLGALAAAVKAGKVKVLGCSNFPGAQWRQALAASAAKAWPRCECDQVEYSLVARSADGDVLPVAGAEKVSVIAWSPLAGGYLTGKYLEPGQRPKGRRQDPSKAFPPLDEKRYGGVVRVLITVAKQEATTPSAAALSWVLSRPGIAAAVVGASSLMQLREDLALKTLSPKSLGFIDQASILCSRAPGPKGLSTPGTFVQL